MPLNSVDLLFFTTLNIFLSASSSVVLVSFDLSYAESVISFDTEISRLRMAASSTIFIYWSTFDAVGTKSNISVKYSTPPTSFKIPWFFNSDVTVVASIGILFANMLLTVLNILAFES